MAPSLASSKPKPHPDTPLSSTETSYRAMTEVDNRADASLIGKHCEASFCHQLDFLPFRCSSCERTFCLDHRTETAHKCTHAGAWAAARRAKSQAAVGAGSGRQLHDYVSRKPCASPDCKTVVGTSLVPGVHCDGCNRDYCLKHRMREEHDCKKLIPLGARPGGGQQFDPREKAVAALEKLKLWGKARAEAAGTRALPKAKPSSTASRIVALNAMKKMAKGDVKIAPEKRVYVVVEAEAETTVAKIPKGTFFYSGDWVVGKVLDAASRSLQVENLNNMSEKEEDKLRVFHVEGGRVLGFSEKIGAAVMSGNTIVLLRGVGAST